MDGNGDDDDDGDDDDTDDFVPGKNQDSFNDQIKAVLAELGETVLPFLYEEDAQQYIL